MTTALAKELIERFLPMMSNLVKLRLWCHLTLGKPPQSANQNGATLIHCNEYEQAETLVNGHTTISYSKRNESSRRRSATPPWQQSNNTNNALHHFRQQLQKDQQH
jgi:hypothetical protein